MLFWSTDFDKAKLETFAAFLANLSYTGRQHLFLQPGSPRIEDAGSQGRVIPFRDKFVSAFPSERWVNFNQVHLGLLPFPKSPYFLPALPGSCLPSSWVAFDPLRKSQLRFNKYSSRKCASISIFMALTKPHQKHQYKTHQLPKWRKGGSYATLYLLRLDSQK